MSFEMKVKLNIKKVVEELIEEKYENLEKNGFMGKITIDDIKEIKQFYCTENRPLSIQLVISTLRYLHVRFIK